MHVVATVPAGDDWCAAEKRWIEVLRTHFPGGANITLGGQGASGMVHGQEMRTKISAIHKGKTVSPETRARIGAASRGRKHPPESIERRAAKMRGTKRPHYGSGKRSFKDENGRLDGSVTYQIIEKRRAKLLAKRLARGSITS